MFKVLNVLSLVVFSGLLAFLMKSSGFSSSSIWLLGSVFGILTGLVIVHDK